MASWAYCYCSTVGLPLIDDILLTKKSVMIGMIAFGTPFAYAMHLTRRPTVRALAAAAFFLLHEQHVIICKTHMES